MSAIQMVEPIHSFENLTLSPALRSQVNDLLDDQEFGAVLRSEEIPVRRRVLMHGPSGCGKTSIAHALAASMKVRVAIVSMSKVVGSHVGETSKEIAKAIEFAASNRCVLLMDEFDSVGMERIGDSGADREASRAVNTLLTELELRPPLGMIVACTNMFGSLDTALLRRFDMILEVPTPPYETLLEIANKVLRGRFSISAEEIVDQFPTPALVVAGAYAALRREVIRRERSKGIELPLFADAKEAAKFIRDSLDQKKPKARGALREGTA